MRSGRLLVALVVALGILGMHGAPAMAAGPRTGTVHAVHADPLLMTPPPGGSRPHPAAHHLLAPCLSSPAPSALGPAAPLPAGTLTPRTGALTALAADRRGRSRGRPAAPPDLDRLCISRT